MKGDNPTIRHGGQGGSESNGLDPPDRRMDAVPSVIRVRRGGFNPWEDPP